MIVHLLSDSSYTINFITYIDRNFQKKDHFFFIHGDKNSRFASQYNQKENCKLLNSKFSFFKYLYFISNSDRVIFHQLNKPWLMLFWIFFDNQIFNKIVWVIWGSDVYDYLETNNSLKYKAIEYLKLRFIKKLKYISSYIYDDYLNCKKFYPNNAKYFKTLYPGVVDLNRPCPPPIVKSNNASHILIGNSADPSNNHLSIFQYLSKFKDENLKLFVFLSYGGTITYKEEIKEKGKQIFNDKIHFIENLMTQSEYFDFLDSIDICVFNHNRQQGLGALIYLIYAGKKIYVSNNTSTFAYYNRLNIRINETEDIILNNFDKLKEIEPNVINENKERILIDLDKEVNITNWKNIMYGNLSE
jgi:dTDP-N-acetylfucosamine:lipid II N-acetylfucosaminyltransferase